ncbi:MAG: PDZ domain-containing protein [bacterium]
MKTFVLCLSFFFILSFLHAESNMDPPLGLVFPLEQKDERVALAQTILINKSCVAQAGAWARVMYLLPRPDDPDVKNSRKLAKYNPAYMRQSNESLLKKDDELTPMQRAAYERAIATIWKNPIAFRSALEQWGNKGDWRLVFQQPGSDELQAETVEFPEGMFLAEQDGRILVLSVEKDSPSAKNGIVAQTALLKINGRDLNGKLEEFVKIYNEEKQAKAKADRALNFTVVFPQSPEEKTVTITLPRSLNTDFWSEIEKH